MHGSSPTLGCNAASFLKSDIAAVAGASTLSSTANGSLFPPWFFDSFLFGASHLRQA